MIKEYCSWKKFELGCEILAEQIDFNPGYLLAIGKDGLLPGTYLSDIMKKPLAVIMVNSYDFMKQNGCKSNGKISCADDIKGSGLIIDGIIDTGKTIQFVKNLITTPTKTAVLYYKPHSIIKPDFHAYQIDNDAWVEFFWRKEHD